MKGMKGMRKAAGRMKKAGTTGGLAGRLRAAGRAKPASRARAMDSAKPSVSTPFQPPAMAAKKKRARKVASKGGAIGRKVGSRLKKSY